MEKADAISILLGNNQDYFLYKNCSQSKSDSFSRQFINAIISTSIYEIINESNTLNIEELKSSDIIQFSNFKNCSYDICKHLKYSGNKGYSYEQLGMYLLDANRKKAALVKYGENHSKTAEMLGFTEIINVTPRVVYISNLGSEFLNINEFEQKQLITRLILRMKLIRYLIKKTLNGKVDVANEINFLSESTVKRRLTNIKTVFDFLKNNSIDNLDFITEKLVF